MITSTAQGRLTGPFDDAATNRDAGGLYQFLTITFTVEVTQAGGFGVLAALTAGGDNLIALGSLSSDTQRAAPVTNIDLAAGSQRVTAYFEGRALRAAGIPGPYTVQLGLFDEAANALDRAQFATAPYDLAQFQGD